MTTDFSWATHAACKDSDRDHHGANWYADAPTVACKRAIEVCGECPVQEECLRYALETNEEYGVWGGMTPAQRFMLARGHSREEALLVTRTYPRQ